MHRGTLLCSEKINKMQIISPGATALLCESVCLLVYLFPAPFLAPRSQIWAEVVLVASCEFLPFPVRCLCAKRWLADDQVFTFFGLCQNWGCWRLFLLRWISSTVRHCSGDGCSRVRSDAVQRRSESLRFGSKTETKQWCVILPHIWSLCGEVVTRTSAVYPLEAPPPPQKAWWNA